MAKRISKSVERVIRNSELFYNVVNSLNESVKYVFISFFANIIHNHFRGSSYFELLVLQESYECLNIIMLEQGFNCLDIEGKKEYFTDELLIKVRISDKEEDFANKELLSVISFDKEYNVWMPSMEVHKHYLSLLNDFWANEDIKILEKNNLEDNSKRRGHLLELYFYGMYINLLHNHKEGSISCPLCNQK